MRKAVAVLVAVLASFLSSPAVSAEPNQGPPPEAAAFIETYLDHLLYMVLVSDKIKIPEGEGDVYRTAVAAANDYLTSQKLPVVFQDQMEKLRRDQRTLAEDLQGENLSVAQWLAQKLNADVYIEINPVFRSEKRGAQWFAQTNLTLNVFEPSTGQLLGSKAYSQLDRSVGASDELAKINAVRIGVKRMMKDVVNIARDNMRRAVANGVRYELKLLGTADAEAVGGFIDALKSAVPPSGANAVTDVVSHSLSDREGTWYVYFFGAPEDFERLVEWTAETVPGFEGMKLVLQRGKSFSFSTGME
ncbi:MAG: hypothetical protein JXD23_09685 [Spirochaetales bacterium]|nr:hypothetical protein [Spirochaetales bacterium]